MLSLVKQVLSQINNVLELLVPSMLIVQLGLDLVPGFIHFMELINQVIMISPRLRQLLLHLVVVDLECAQLELILVRLQLG